MRMLIMGPPGAGKGTQAEIIANHYGIPAISTGSMFRAEIDSGSPLGERVKQIIAEGEYVPDEVTLDIVAQRLQQPDAASGWLLDGFPRTLGQVDALGATLDAQGQKLDVVVALTADSDAMIARMLKRADIEGRPDDNEATIRNRLEVYRDQTGPLLDVYRDRGLLVEVDGMGTIEEVTEGLLAALAERLGR